MSWLKRIAGLFGRPSRGDEREEGEKRLPTPAPISEDEWREREMRPRNLSSKDKKRLRTVAQYMASEEMQNRNNDPLNWTRIVGGPNVDRLPGATGEFGRDLDNPIPANGVVGESVYLSQLRTTDAGQRLMFHQLGIASSRYGPVAVYEAATLDGRMWDVLYLSRRHPRKSRQAPEGYRISDRKPTAFMFGVNHVVSDFPEGITEAVATLSEDSFGFSLASSLIREAEAKTRFKRPPEQEERRKAAYEVIGEIHQDGTGGFVLTVGDGLNSEHDNPPSLIPMPTSAATRSSASKPKPKSKRKPKPQKQGKRKKKRKRRK